jgi:uncharacterized membrane protein YedE/YeeE
MATREVTVSQERTSFSWARIPGWLKWGALIGFVQIFAIVTVAPLGVSTAYPQFVGFVFDKIFPGFAQEQLYLREIGTKLGWEVMLVFGLFLGALLSYVLSRWRERASLQACVEPVYVKGFTDGKWRRYARAFLGGFLFIFGARLAGGCTTGHILSGTTQMALSGLLFAAAAFGTAMLVAKLFFREPLPAKR